MYVVYKDWLTQYKGDDSTDKKQFFQHLSREYVDYQQLRRIQPGSRGVRKSKKLFRNIAREIHSDKLPDLCRGSEMKQMMSTILGRCEKIKDCIAQPPHVRGRRIVKNYLSLNDTKHFTMKCTLHYQVRGQYS